METKRQPKKVAFCCPHHGVLREPVEYFSVNIGTKKLVDTPVMYCKECKKYYTPFTNLLAFTKLRYKGHEVVASQGRVQKSIPREEVRMPYFVDMEEDNQQKEQQRIENTEKHKQYIAGLREVYHDCIILTNKPCFINEYRCPLCQEITKKERLKITQRWKFLLANVRHCDHCGRDYITPRQHEILCSKAREKIRGHYCEPFISFVDIHCEHQEDNNYLFIPSWALDFEKYDYRHLPPKGDEFYDMTDEEYLWVKMYHQPEEFPVQLRVKSFLGEAGYSTSESEIRRHNILSICVDEYGKSKVVNQLKSNINLRLKQKDGNIRYAHAINIWHGDIWYVENQL